MESPAFDYRTSVVPVRDDIVAAHERAWDRLRPPGTWWTGAERVEIAAEVRNAFDCELCRERKQALSPYGMDGALRATASRLDPTAVDAVHRIVTDATRLTQDRVERLGGRGLSDGHYVELLGVVVTVLGIDELHRGLGVPLATLAGDLVDELALRDFPCPPAPRRRRASCSASSARCCAPSPPP